MAKKQINASAERKVQRKGKPQGGENSVPAGKADDTEQEGFQHWVNDQLRKLYDPVLDEPIPEGMLELLRKSRRSR